MTEAPAAKLPGPRLPLRFYSRDTLEVARDLLGAFLCRRENSVGWTVGRIVETEAYVGEDDPACHAAAGMTPRTRVMFGPPGRSYVYFTYGMHNLLNVVTEPRGRPAAVLIRALEPVSGVKRMRRRRPDRTPDRGLASGPARLCQALGIDLAWNDIPLHKPPLLVCPGKRPGRIASGSRVGITKGLDRPWRFWIRDSEFVSK